MDFLLSGLGMLACMAAMAAIMPLLGRIATFLRARHAAAPDGPVRPDTALPR
jgi:hypothetical protein